MDVSSINNAFALREESTSVPVTGSIEYIGGAATFKPTVDLKGNTTYTASIATSASDLAGNKLAASNSNWTFTMSEVNAGIHLYRKHSSHRFGGEPDVGAIHLELYRSCFSITAKIHAQNNHDSEGITTSGGNLEAATSTLKILVSAVKFRLWAP